MNQATQKNVPTRPSGIAVGLLTGGGDKPYAFGMALALTSRGVSLDYIGSDDVDSPELHTNPRLTFLNLKGDQRQDVSLITKAWRISSYYARLMRYTATSKPAIFHILWNNKFQLFDRTLLMLYYKLQGKKIVFTAHNVNAGKRDANDSLLNRLTLRMQYRLSDHIFVHTEAMKTELARDFGIREQAITVIPFGINNAVPHTSLTPAEAKQRLGIGRQEKTILFYGHIGPYKGLEFLVDAFQRVAARDPECRLIIAGRPMRGCQEYFDNIQRTIAGDASSDRVIQRIEFIPDEETETYFKAADVLVLPYTEVFQSGVLFLGYSFGLPVVAADVGSLKEEIVEGRTGFLCKPRDPADIAAAIGTYFESDLFKNLDDERHNIREYANNLHSWDVVGDKTVQVYAGLASSPRRTLVSKVLEAGE